MDIYLLALKAGLLSGRYRTQGIQIIEETESQQSVAVDGVTKTQLEHSRHVKSFLKEIEANQYYLRLLQLPWKKIPWGRGKFLPRLAYRYGDDGQTSDVLEELKSVVEKSYGVTVRSIWCNQYRNGQDYTPEHQDQYGGYVFTLSFGQDRVLYFRNTSTGERTNLKLEHGDLNYFSPQWDAAHRHCVPKDKSQSIRISVVFFT